MNGMTLSIRKRIYLSFSLLVILFVINGLITIFTLNNIRDVSMHLSNVIDPSLEAIRDFRKMMHESNSYTTNLVFLKYAQEDKLALEKLHSIEYPALKSQLRKNSLYWKANNWTDSLNKVFKGFEDLLIIEKDIMRDLKNTKDNEASAFKINSERKIEEEILPRTAVLLNTLNNIRSYWLNVRAKENLEARQSEGKLRSVIVLLAIIMIFFGFLLSMYLTKKIIGPIKKIRGIVNDLGKGITKSLNHKADNDEIGEMVTSVNNLSENLRKTAAFATEIGNKNFDAHFEVLSEKDTLGKALIAMRANLRKSDESANEAQHIAKLGSWEWDTILNKLSWSDELYLMYGVEKNVFLPDYENFLTFIHPEDKQHTITAITKTLKDHTPFAFEHRIITGNNVIKFMLAQGRAALNDKGEVIKLFGTGQDITERKKAEQELEVATRELGILFNSIDEIFFSVNMTSLKVIQISATCEKLYGYSENEFMADYKLWFDIIHPDDKHVLNNEDELLRQGKYVNNQYRIIRKDKTIRWVETNITPTLNENGNLIRVDGVTRDITQRKNAEQALETSEAFNKGVLASLNSHIAVIDDKGLVIAVNKAWEDFSRANNEIDLVRISKGRNYFDLCKRAIAAGDEIAKQALDGILSVLKKEKNIFELEYPYYSSGEQRWFLLRVTNFESDAPKIVLTHQNITARKEAEMHLRESNYRFELVTKATNDAIWDWDLLTNEVYMSDAYAKLYGYCVPGNKMHISLWSARIHPDDARKVVDGIENEIKNSDTGNWEDEYRYIKKNGDVAYVYDRGQIVYDEDKKPIRMVGAMQDITSRKKAEAELKNSEENYRQIVETAQEGIWLGDENNRITFVNKKMAEILEYSPEEMIGKEDCDFMLEREKDLVLKTSLKRRKGVKETYELQFVTKSGKLVWTQVSANPVFGEDGDYKGSLAMVTDITKRKQSEEQLKRSQANLVINNFKLEQKNKELEQFAYVASHDLQEPLRTTISFVEIFKQQYFGKLDSKADKYLDFIVQASDRMRVLINDLLDFSRIGINKDVQQVDCNMVLKDAVTDLDKAIKDSGAEIQSEILPVVSGYSTELKQLFQNLISNSIKFRHKDLTPKIKISAEEKSDHWRFAFSDNGIGIDPKYNERIFIIFQRLHTRKEYQGSGIGLSHCKKIAELHHGKIWVQSTPGKGCTFYFTIHSSKEKINEAKVEMHNAD